MAEDMQTIVQLAMTTSSMAAIVAPSGSGKTATLQVLAEKYHGRYLYCTSDMTPLQLLEKIAKVIGVARHTHNRAQLLDAIVQKLRGTHRPLFLDEAHCLPKGALPRIRAIYDQADIPIIMAGTHEILRQINDRSDGRGQFASRCIQYNVLEHVLNAEGPNTPDTHTRSARPLFTKSEIKVFLDHLQVKFDPQGFDMAWAIACLPNHGCLRTLKRIVMLLRPSADTRHQPITRRQIIQVLPLMFGRGDGGFIGMLADNYVQLIRKAG